MVDLLVTSPTNIRYLAGFTGVSETEREAYVLVTNSTIYLFTNALYLEQAHQLTKSYQLMANGCQLRIVEISRENPLSQALFQVLTELEIKQLGFEENNLTVAEYTKLTKELRGITLIPTKNEIETRREIKQAKEIKHIQSACRITDACFTYITKQLKPGVREIEIAWKIEEFIRNKNAQLAFSPIVAFGNHSSQPHHSPSESCKLEAESLVLLDFGARVNGYCADMTRAVFVGQKVPHKMLLAYNAVFNAQQSVIKKLKQGERSGAKLDTLAREIIIKAGFLPYPHSLGHAVGLDIHESPRLTHTNDAILKPGMVFSVEPGVYLQDEFGIRIEDLVLLQENGIKVLSKSSKKLSLT